jgi:hypothetical protein
MSYPKGDCEYLARTLAATMLDLSPEDQAAVLRYLAAELERLGLVDPLATLDGFSRQPPSARACNG